MPRTKKTTEKPEATVELLAKALEGRASLERYSDDRGTIVAFRGGKEIFWVDFYELKALVEKFDEIIEIKDKKPLP